LNYTAVTGRFFVSADHGTLRTSLGVKRSLDLG
jgi:hypothetical protein